MTPRLLTPEDFRMMREWLSANDTSDTNWSEYHDLDVLRVIDVHYPGGSATFLRDVPARRRLRILLNERSRHARSVFARAARETLPKRKERK